MNEYTTFLDGNVPWLWIGAAVLLFLLETIVPGVHFLWFGLAAIVVGILTFATGITWPLQLVLFALISLATVFVIRKFARRDKEMSDEPLLNIRAQQYVGRVVRVDEAISGGRGKVRVGDTVWNAEGRDAPTGTEVRVTGFNGTTLTVEPA